MTTLDDAVKQSRKEARIARAEDLAQRLQEWAANREPAPKQQIDLRAERKRANDVAWMVGFIQWGLTAAWLLSGSKRFRNTALFFFVIGGMLGSYERSLDREIADQ